MCEIQIWEIKCPAVFLTGRAKKVELKTLNYFLFIFELVFIFEFAGLVFIFDAALATALAALLTALAAAFTAFAAVLSAWLAAVIVLRFALALALFAGASPQAMPNAPITRTADRAINFFI